MKYNYCQHVDYEHVLKHVQISIIKILVLFILKFIMELKSIIENSKKTENENEILVGLAPMFEVNDLAFRILCRKYNVQLCWTGMVNVHNWATQPHLRNKFFQTCDIDRPLIVQLSGNNEDELIACAKDLEQFAIAIDINLGCTQHIARRGQYGYFMVNTENKRQNVIDMVKNIVQSINLPFTAKLRLINGEDGEPDIELTKNFAIELEKAGVSVLSVHGRQKNSNKAGPVDAEAIRQIADAVKIPVFANGGVSTKKEGIALVKASHAAGLLVGQGLLKNPRAFSNTPEPDPVNTGREYLELFKKYPDQNFYIARRHIFNFFEDYVRTNTKISEYLKSTQNIEQLEQFLNDFENGKYSEN